MTDQDAVTAFSDFLSYRHSGLSVDDVELDHTQGFWILKELCQGMPKCQHPFHTTLFNNRGPLRHVIHFSEDKLPQEFRYRVWNTLRGRRIGRCRLCGSKTRLEHTTENIRVFYPLTVENHQVAVVYAHCNKCGYQGYNI